MNYVILADSRQKTGEKVALVDRSRFRDQWWTENISKAITFTSMDAAKRQLATLKFNNPQIWTVEKAAVRLRQVAVVVSGFEKALARKQKEWHDDDWHEGMND